VKQARSKACNLQTLTVESCLLCTFELQFKIKAIVTSLRS